MKIINIIRIFNSIELGKTKTNKVFKKLNTVLKDKDFEVELKHIRKYDDTVSIACSYSFINNISRYYFVFLTNETNNTGNAVIIGKKLFISSNTENLNSLVLKNFIKERISTNTVFD